MKPGLRIDALHVKGFGHFSDFSRELGPGMHLLYGPNEAGKSTLLAFLRSMLFGFAKRDQPERYEPEGGGPFGGELRLSTAEGPLLVRRAAVGRRSEGELTVQGADGVELPRERLEAALAHVTRELFFDVFAFRLDELAGFEQLVEERGASEALVAASMRGARRLPEVVARLKKDSEALYKPGGVKPDLNVALKALEDVQERLRQEGNRPALYFAHKDQLEALGGEQRALEVELREVGQERDRLERLEAALGDTAALAEARAEWESLPALADFPEGGEARLEDLLQRRRQYRAELARLAERLATVEAERGRLSGPSFICGQEDSLRAALGAVSERSGLLRTLPARRATLEAKRRQVEVALEESGLAVDAAGLLAMDLSAGARAGLEALVARLGSAETWLREAGAALGRDRTERQRLDGVVARLESELAGLPETRSAQVRLLQSALGRLREVRGAVERLSEQRAETGRRLEGVRAQGEVPPPEVALPAWTVWVGAAVAGVLSAVVGWLAGAPTGAVCVAGTLALVGLLAWVRRRVDAGHRAALEVHARRQQQRDSEAESLRASLATLTAREDVFLRERADLAAEVGLPVTATAADLAACDTALSAALEAAGRREALLRDREARRAEREAAVEEERQANEAAREAEEARHGLMDELEALLAARRFPPKLPPAASVALWRDASTLRQRLQDLGAEEAALKVDEAACATVAAKLCEEAMAAKLLPESPLEHGGIEALVARTASALEAARVWREETRRLEERERELLEEKARLDGLARAEDEAFAALLSEGGCSDEESFRRRAAQARRYSELSHRLRELSHRIEARTGLRDDEARQALREAGGEAGLRSSLETQRARHSTAQERLKAVLTEQGARRNQLQHWENDDLLAKLRMEEETLRARASELATRYAADRLTLALLERARRSFEQEQQPRVVQLASEHFAMLTGGRYPRVFIPATGERELRVDDGHRHWSADKLSRGTREQLYLAFRLAVVRDFGETRGVLPLIVDDVLVNFDAERARRAIQVLARLSEHHQVIAFTCHDWLRLAFSSEGARVQELSPAHGGIRLHAPSP